MKAEEAYALSRKYTENTVAGAGAVAGKPCQIQSITDITGGHRVTFLWKDNSNVDHTSVMDVMDGKGIKAVAVNSSNHLIITYDDDTIVDAGEIDIHSAVNSVNGKTGNVNLTASDVGALPNNTSIPSKTSDLTNDSIVDSASYDSANHQILFKNGTTTLFSLDATAFVKDGMVDDVEISGGNLVITFNTDAGKQAISIPLTDIFDPANYYDKDDVDGLLADKADETDVDSAIAGQQSLLKDTVGWTGKNLLKNTATTQTKNGVTFTVNDNKSITVNGTATADVYFNLDYINNSDTTSKDITNLVGETLIASISKTDVGIRLNVGYFKSDGYVDIISGLGSIYTSKEFVYPEDALRTKNFLHIPSGLTLNNVTLYPMLRKADITDPTYEPYHESVEVMYEEEIHGVNLLKVNVTSKTIDGITYTFNANNSVTLNGTSTRAYTQYDMAYRYIATFTGMVRLNGGLSANIHLYPWDLTRGARPYKDSSKTELQTGNQYNSNGDMLFYVEKGNAYYINPRVVENGTTFSNTTIYPMLRKADIEDGTYRPYNHQAIQNQLNAQGVLGAKNLLENTATTQTINGVTFTVNADGSVTANGTASATAFLPVVPNNTMTIKKGSYILSAGDGIIGNYSKYGLYINNASGDIANTKTEEITHFALSADILVAECKIFVTSGTTVSNLTFYPMLRLASDPDDTYQPYAMTNRELTEEVNTANNAIDNLLSLGQAIYSKQIYLPANGSISISQSYEYQPFLLYGQRNILMTFWFTSDGKTSIKSKVISQDGESDAPTITYSGTPNMATITNNVANPIRFICISYAPFTVS